MKGFEAAGRGRLVALREIHLDHRKLRARVGRIKIDQALQRCSCRIRTARGPFDPAQCEQQLGLLWILGECVVDQRSPLVELATARA